jgi:menaquinone-specific isochorismate synthase
MRRQLSPEEQKRLRALQTRRIERLLDRGAGSCLLANPRIARAMSEVLSHFDGSRYELFAWCVMPNHVHAVVRPLGGHALSEILHSWKSYSNRVVNRVLGKSGAIWQREYYDHLVRDEEDFLRCVRYVIANPRKAGLRDWPWVGSAVRTQ